MEDTNIALIGVILVLIGVISSFFIVKVMLEYSGREVALKEALARETALVINTLCASPYDVEFTYQLDLKGKILEITDQTVIVQNIAAQLLSNILKKSDVTYGDHQFNCNIAVSGKISDKKGIVFRKEKNQISVS